jgi:hypothetical protein
MAATTNPYAQQLGDREPMPVLESTPGRLRELTTSLPDDLIGTPPEPGKWSIHQIVAHLADVELVFTARARMMLFEDNPTLVAFNQDNWVDGWVREKESFEQTLNRFGVLRESTVRLFRNTPPHDLERYGTHTERGPQKVRDYIGLLAGHDLNHLAQIERLAAR